MEESTKRREILKAMRMEASQEDATYNNDHSAVSLSNPLLESTTNSETQAQTTSQSFNYYTNPLAAYYGNKHRSKVSLQTSQTFPSPAPQPHINHSPYPQMQQPQGYYGSSIYAYSSNPQQSSNLPNLSWRAIVLNLEVTMAYEVSVFLTHKPTSPVVQNNMVQKNMTLGLSSGRGRGHGPGQGGGQPKSMKIQFQNNMVQRNDI
ncbi:putative protein SICKLE [Helianthus annuus]|uniref:Uncharacterized protein n=1 Tax=Helianthus annuus TaxID=4232 RepID=A0A9K3HEG3_HELAN|nr:putative protein SICKLE [Helianthus annuus]